jgi:cytochrome P450
MRAVFYYLFKNPGVQEELQRELASAYREGRLTVPVKYGEAIKLPFLCACIKEAMRLHPSVGLTMPRIIPPEGMELCGRRLPGGYRVGMNAAVIHYDTSIFGADADQYRPRRWIGVDTTFMDRYMMQFGAGTRTCIGKNVSTQVESTATCWWQYSSRPSYSIS